MIAVAYECSDWFNRAVPVESSGARQHGIMAWDAIAYDSMFPLARIRSTMTVQRYVDDVLQPGGNAVISVIPDAFFRKVMSDRTLLASANVRYKVQKCFPGHFTFLIFH